MYNSSSGWRRLLVIEGNSKEIATMKIKNPYEYLEELQRQSAAIGREIFNSCDICHGHRVIEYEDQDGYWNEKTCTCTLTEQGSREDSRLISERIRIDDALRKEEEDLSPVKGGMVRVWRGYKVPHGDYQCLALGQSEFGSWVRVDVGEDKSVFISRRNVVGLLECPLCKVVGLSQEVRLSAVDPSTICWKTLKNLVSEARKEYSILELFYVLVNWSVSSPICCVCRDKLLDAGVIED